MSQAIIIRVEPEDFDRWLDAHNSCRELRSGYGMTDGPVYKDESDPTAVLVHLDVENLDRAMGWFQSPEFKDAAKRAGNARREVWAANRAR